MDEQEKLAEAVLQIAQRLATMHARQDALQIVLISTLTALAKSNLEGGRQIEQMSLRMSELLAAKKEDSPHADEIRLQTETILATVRAAVTGKPF